LEADEVSAFRTANASERSRRTGWIPSLTAGIHAADLDARELLAEAMAAALPEAAEGGGTGVAATNQLARRRQSNDAFLEQLATKYARPNKKQRASAKKQKPKSKARPDDMEFVMFQDRIGLDARTVARKRTHTHV